MVVDRRSKGSVRSPGCLLASALHRGGADRTPSRRRLRSFIRVHHASNASATRTDEEIHDRLVPGDGWEGLSGIHLRDKESTLQGVGDTEIGPTPRAAIAFRPTLELDVISAPFGGLAPSAIPRNVSDIVRAIRYVLNMEDAADLDLPRRCETAAGGR
jgi:hypothetical protein